MGNLIKEFIAHLKTAVRRANDPREPTRELYKTMIVELVEQLDSLVKTANEIVREREMKNG